jgi:hypothetical protein
VPAICQQGHGVENPTAGNLGNHHQCRQYDSPTRVPFCQGIPFVEQVSVPPVFDVSNVLHKRHAFESFFVRNYIDYDLICLDHCRNEISSGDAT